MAKLKLTSWLSSSQPAPTETEKKKEKRRSYVPSAFTRKSVEISGVIDKTLSAETVPAEPPSRMIALAQQITRDTEKLESYLKANNLPALSYDVNVPADFPKLPEDIARSRRDIIQASKELTMLAHGPREALRWAVWEFLDVLALQIINYFGIAKLFPVGETITLKELADKTTLDPVNLARAIRLVITKGIFREPSDGVIAHTAGSQILAEDGDMQAWIGFNAEDIFPASAHVLDSVRKYPDATQMMQSGFCFAFNTVDKEPMFVTFGKNADRARRMGKAMVSLTGGEGYEMSYLIDVEGGGYDFSEIDAAGGTLVDLGGSHGFVSVELARKYKKMKFVVQDTPQTIASAPSPICQDAQVADRITMQAHSFFEEQVVKDADVYFFRWIIHNYSTPFAVKILKNLIPALKPGARIIINDHCLRDAGQEDAWDETVMRRMDMVMWALLNAQERTEAEFRDLFKAASDGFVFKGVTRPKNCRMSIIEAVWQPKEEPKDEFKAESGEPVKEV
ncbi:putative s-adenosyl-l-methionine-dependent methyltransferase [Podospora aff. communis PSN243]|uniref:S-adenosyl-l-methionine-dependent methyltransferase n=1 Tax=Podospora aff. communis PSN243 TaxID=3040156 RepID=A0AAV9H098_9PEZI|nr:putative s-adenosyl-l-methionine-dependent methyltransferase [Podospora aff. communis PSN243]